MARANAVNVGLFFLGDLRDLERVAFLESVVVASHEHTGRKKSSFVANL